MVCLTITKYLSAVHNTVFVFILNAHVSICNNANAVAIAVIELLARYAGLHDSRGAQGGSNKHCNKKVRTSAQPHPSAQPKFSRGGKSRVGESQDRRKVREHK